MAQPPLSPYTPIDCNYYDILLAKASLKEECEIVYKESDEEQKIVGKITDVFSRKGAEYLQCNGSIEIRLDQLIRINEHWLPKDPNCKID